MRTRIQPPARGWAACPATHRRSFGAGIRHLIPGLAATIVLTTVASPASAELTVTNEKNLLRIEGVKGNATVIWMSVWHEMRDNAYLEIQTFTDIAIDGDGDGMLEVSFDRPIPARSAWAVFELATGESALIVPEQRRASPHTDAKGVIALSASALDELSLDRPDLRLLWGRPITGAWSLSTRHHVRSHRDGHTVGLSDFEAVEPLPKLDGASQLPPLEAPPPPTSDTEIVTEEAQPPRWRGRVEYPRQGGLAPPATLAAGDKVFAIDPKSLEVTEVEFAN